MLSQLLLSGLLSDILFCVRVEQTCTTRLSKLGGSRVVPVLTLPRHFVECKKRQRSQRIHSYPCRIAQLLKLGIEKAVPFSNPLTVFLNQEGKPSLLTEINQVLLLGPLLINSTHSLVSMTVPIVNNTSYTDIMGYMTVVLDNSLIWDVVNSSIGLTETGVTLLIGPNTINNMITNTSQARVSVDRNSARDLELRFVLPPEERYSKKRHAEFAYGNRETFNGSRYHLVLEGLTQTSTAINNAGGALSSRNEENIKIGLGYAKVPTSFCDWLVVVESSRSEAWGPINIIQNVLLACIFATAFGAALWTFPIAYWGSAPIRRLREATTNAIESSEASSTERLGDLIHDLANHEYARKGSKDGLVTTVTEKSFFGSPNFRKSNRNAPIGFGGGFKKTKIPQRVKDSNHWIEDDLTDLTKNFNQMSDELNLQYEKIEERVSMCLSFIAHTSTYWRHE